VTEEPRKRKRQFLPSSPPRFGVIEEAKELEMSNCCTNPPIVGESESDAGDEALVCLHCGSDELNEVRTVLQLVRATGMANGFGFETEALAEEDVLELAYACAACDRELTGDTLVPLSTR
jgi:DNA-directed RNA polymerase subunit RPC12/RpoP